MTTLVGEGRGSLRGVTCSRSRSGPGSPEPRQAAPPFALGAPPPRSRAPSERPAQRDKGPELLRLREELEELKVLLRLCHDVKAFPNLTAFEYAIRQMTEIAK